MSATGKIIICHVGDTHGNKVPMQEIVTKVKPNFIIHTGDCTDTEVDDDGYVQATKDLGLVYGTNFANSQGNHESPEESGEGAQKDVETAFPTLKTSKWMQNYQVGNVFIIIGNTQISGYSQPDNEHMTFIKTSLAKAKQLCDAGQIDWIFYAQHKPYYTMKARHDSEYNFRYNVHPLFDQYGVDISVHGHNHDMQRTKPITYGGPANTPPKTNDKMIGDAHDLSTIPHGVIVAINGSSTKNTAFSGSQDAWTVYANANGNAYSVYTIEGKKLTGQFIEIGTGKVLHEFKVTKEKSGPTTPPPTTPPPTEQPPTTPAPGPGFRWDPVSKTWIPKLEDPHFVSGTTTNTTPPPSTQPPTTPPPRPIEEGAPEIDEYGIAWFVAKGKKTTIVKQSRDEADDDRWSQNVPGCEDGFEQTMIAKSIGIASDGHFASKLGGSNHSKGDWAKERWMDLGVRSDGSVQLQWEGPHPSNHDFELPGGKLLIKNIGKPLEGNWIGLKWAQNILKKGGSPANGGVRWRMWVNTDIAEDGKPDNSKWKLAFDFIDGVDVKVIQPQDFVMTGTMDAEIRRSGTKEHLVYAGGLLIRPFN